MLNIESSSKFCLFCYKSVASSGKTHDSSYHINKFVKTLNQFSGRHAVNPIFNSGEFLECCLKCEDIINDFCRSYTDFKELELKLDYMLDKLVEKINYANKVPARWIHVNKVLEETLWNDFDKKADHQKHIRKLRHNVIEAGLQRKQRSQPRVLLSRTENIIQLVKPSVLTGIIKEPTCHYPEKEKTENQSFREQYKNKVCPKCGKTLKTWKGLQTHLEQHKDPSEWKHQCQFCPKRFAAQSNFKKHLRMHTGERPYKCRFCKFRFRYRSDFTRHLRRTHGNEKGVEKELKRKWNIKPVQDTMYLETEKAKVDLEAENQSSIQQHHNYSTTRKRVTKNTNIQNAQLQKETTCLTEDMPANLSKYENIIECTTFPTDDIGTEFDDMPELDDYSADINDDTVEGIHITYENEYVDANILDTNDQIPIFKDPLIQIKVEHYQPADENVDVGLTADGGTNIDGRRTLKSKGGRPACKKGLKKEGHTCSECGKKLSSKGALIIHLEYHKDPEDWQYKCKDCGKKFARGQALNEHMKKHTRERPFVCRVCGEKFGYNISLNKHLNDKHGNIEEDMEEESDDGERRRILKSKGGRPRSVKNIVRKLCKTSSFYNREQTCLECGKKLSSKAALKTHLEFHKNPKDWKYKCEKCGKMFARGQALKEHMRRHTREQPYVCRYCGEKYSQKRSLVNHLNVRHGNEEGVEEEIEMVSNNFVREIDLKNGILMTTGTSQLESLKLKEHMERHVKLKKKRRAAPVKQVVLVKEKLLPLVKPQQNRYGLRKSRKRNVSVHEMEIDNSGNLNDFNGVNNQNGLENDTEETDEVAVQNIYSKEEIFIAMEELIENKDKNKDQEKGLQGSGDDNLWTRKGTCFGDGTLVEFEDLD